LFGIIEPPLTASVGTAGDPSRDCGGDPDLLMLKELAEIGMKIARAVGREFEPGCMVEPAKAAELERTFSRAARAVRQTLALKARLAELKTRPAQTADRPVRGANFVERQHERRQKSLVRHVVEQVIKAAASGREAEDLLADMRERLKDPDIEDELGYRAAEDIVIGICRDLGIKLSYRLLDDATLHALMADRERLGAATNAAPRGDKEAAPTLPAAEVRPRAPP
jgi:hypothetical protein